MSDKHAYFCHERAMVDSLQIGKGTRIWANAHVMKDVVIGEYCNIGENCFIESGVVIGNHVVIKNNVSVWNGVVLEDGVFVGPSAVFTNEMEPRSTFPKELSTTLVKQGASIGANATIVANRIIGQYATIGAGSVVTRDVPSHRLVYGNPARVRGWVCICGRKLDFFSPAMQCACGRNVELKNDLLILIP